MNLPLRARLLGMLQARNPSMSAASTPVDRFPELRAKLTPQPRWPMTLVSGRMARTVRIDGVSADLAGREVPIRRYTPNSGGTELRPVVVDFHSGGFSIGTPALRDWFNSHLAERTGAIVASVDYRLAPEHPFPCAYDDSVDATVWVAENAHRWGGNPQRMALLGDSAGANLAAGVALATTQQPGMPTIRTQVLAYGAFDFVDDYPSAREFAHEIFLNEEDSNAMIGHYLGETDRGDVRVSPLRADDLSGLPPALVITAEHDMLRDQSVAYADALRDAGVSARCTMYPRTAHGFLSCPGLYPAAIHALADVSDHLRYMLADRSVQR